MTFATLEIIHNLLTEELDQIEADLDEAGQVLREVAAIHSEAAEDGDGEAAEKINEAERHRRALAAELRRIKAATDEFNGQDWH